MRPVYCTTGPPSNKPSVGGTADLWDHVNGESRDNGFAGGKGFRALRQAQGERENFTRSW